ncbi:ATP-binding cassette domain-containing protein [Microbacterium sp. No. 7]|uniref:ATP-binding cassette domain-containing protein n=1 Tax=Microbacterium sp. No. 7 TaxID=1714373 RepID=UPI0006CF36AD|nr:ATP-binding cassette domain-containing protein [Microbacterium sp. No. 7]ALJ21516.1 hypothetical protein AOA12_17105 [Microbacterium sp. No. 7]
MLFENVTVTVRAGQMVAVTGPSGAGKSTLLSIVAGWLPPLAGTVRREHVARTHWVFQNPYGLPRRTALDHVAFPFLARGERRPDAASAATRLMRRFGLGDRTRSAFADLSGGEAQRLMLARAVAAQPQLLLVDEPTAQLDRASARTVNEVLAGLAGEGTIVLVASHDPETVAACPDAIELGGGSVTRPAP